MEARERPESGRAGGLDGSPKPPDDGVCDGE
jgi:hypothetical protein